MLTIKDIIMWERLLNRPFSTFNGAQMDDVTALMYCQDVEHQRTTSLRVYQMAAPHTKELQTFARDMSHELSFVDQFSREDEETANRKVSRTEKVYFTEVFQTLVFRGGISAEWLLSQGMEILPILAEGITNRYHEEQSDKKFWVLLNMSPHMSASSQRKLRNSLTFDWEKEKSGRLTNEQEMALGPALFNGIMKKKEENK